MKLTKLTILALSLLFYGNIAFSATQPNNIDILTSEWLASFNSGKVNNLQNLYTKNAVMFPPSSEIVESPAAISAYFDSLKNIGVNAYTFSDVSLDIKGDLAYATSIWEATRVDTNGNEFTFEGNISSVLEKQTDGSWKIKMQSWN